MIFGVGVDIVAIDRIKQAMENKQFLNRNFTENEVEYFQLRKFSPATVAGNFACKEAFSKAIGTGIRGFSLKEIEILREQDGKPYIVLYGNAKEITDGLGITGLFSSISHEGLYAVANVIAERTCNK